MQVPTERSGVLVLEKLILAVLQCRSLPGGKDLILDLEASPYETLETLRTRVPCSLAEEVAKKNILSLTP